MSETRAPRMFRPAVHTLAISLLLVGCDAATGRVTARDAGADGAADAGPPVCRIPEPIVLDEGVDGGAPCGDVLTTIVRETCVGGICHHAGRTPAAGLDLLSPCAADRLVGVPSTCNGRLLVDPGDVERSFLVEKLTVDPPECGGESMPYDNHLPPRELACMRQWISAIARWSGPP